MKNSTKSGKFFKVAAAMFAVCFILASILYIIPYSGKVKFFDFNEAKKKSFETNKPIYVSFSARWNNLSKKISKTLYANDSVADFLNENTVPALFKVDDESGEDSAREAFGIDQFVQPLFLDKYGRFLSQVYVSDVNGTLNHLRFLMKNPFLYFSDFEDGIKKSVENGKLTVLMVIENPEMANGISAKWFSDILEQSGGTYNFASLLLYARHDEPYMNEISKRFQNINLQPQPIYTGRFKFKVNAEAPLTVLIFDKNRNLAGNFVIENLMKNNFSIKDSLAKYSNNVDMNNSMDNK